MPRSRSRLPQASAVVLAAAAVALLSSAFLIGSTPDEEEFRFAVLSTWLRMRALGNGDHPFWTPLLGLGLPQPFIPNFTLHPLAPLLVVTSPVAWVRLLLFAHTVIGAVGMWLVGKALRLTPLVTAVCVVTFLFAAPVQNYVLTDFWPSHYVVWTSIPWVLLVAWRVLQSDAKDARRWVLLLGLVTGFMVVNANPAYLLVYGPIAIGMVVADWRRAPVWLPALAAAGLIMVAIAAPTLVQLATERRYFAPDLALSNVTQPLRYAEAWQPLVRPFTPSAGSRTLFLGAPFLVLCCAGVLWFARARFELVFAAAVSAVLLFNGSIPLPWVSQRYQFRDPLTLCAILLAGLAADRLLRTPRTPGLAIVALGLQVVAVVGGTWPYLRRTWEPEWQQASAFRGATGAMPLVNTLVDRMPAAGRLLYSPRVDHDVSERGLVADGLGINALAYRGVAVVNGSFKGISADVVWPNDRLFYGRVRTPRPFIAADAGLDVLGIRYVIAHRDERVADGLRQLTPVTTVRGAELVLYENRDAWPVAFLLAPPFGDQELPLYPDCGNDRLLCRDFSGVLAHRDPRALNIERGPAEIRIRWTPASEPRVLVVSEMFRPEWVATSGDRILETRAMYGALLGVPLPADAADVRLEYRATPQRAAATVSYGAMLAAILAVVLMRKR